ncbi:hypothetical protein RB195_024188 [Necator americanus]|uniref:Uncharacterized protein n=1 Tax=Necator americanus TaxID=51031 RepID=A0ABR1EMJ7_NECAM
MVQEPHQPDIAQLFMVSSTSKSDKDGHATAHCFTPVSTSNDNVNLAGVRTAAVALLFMSSIRRTFLEYHQREMR